MPLTMPLVALLATVVAPPPAALAARSLWGPQGHRIVCEIAWRRLTPQARDLVKHLLRDDAVGFAEACTWADEVRGTTHQYTSTYHYVNIPSGTGGLDLARDCADPVRRCVTWAIAHYALMLADRSTSRRERTEALKFLGHFAGDLHQPLHAGRPGDRGGNDVFVEFFGIAGDGDRRLNLHWTWDTMILEHAGLRWPEDAAVLDAEIGPDEPVTWQDADVVRWTNESYRVCEEVVYDLPPGNAIGEEYDRRAAPIVRRRLQQGGVRLAYLINQAAAGTLAFPAPLDRLATAR